MVSLLIPIYAVRIVCERMSPGVHAGEGNQSDNGEGIIKGRTIKRIMMRPFV